MVLFTALGISFLVWLFFVIQHKAGTGNWKFVHFTFSEKRYHLLMLGFPMGIVLTSLYKHTPQPIALFLFFAVAGIFGEFLLSSWWHAFFGQRLWVYSVDTLYHAYTSMLNFIPWGIAGMLSLEMAQVVIGKDQLTAIFSDGGMYGTLAIVYFGALITQLLVFYFVTNIHSGHYRFHEVTLFNYLFFTFPMLAVFAFFTIWYSPSFLILTILYGALFAVFEYLFGKATSMLLSRKLWIYSYLSYDNGHFSPTSIVPFAVGGFWFVITYGFFTLYLPFR